MLAFKKQEANKKKINRASIASTLHVASKGVGVLCSGVMHHNIMLCRSTQQPTKW